MHQPNYFITQVNAQQEEDDPAKLNVKKWLKVDDQKTYDIPECGDKVSYIGCLIVRLINYLVSLIGIVSFGIIILGGLTLVTAGGDDTRITKGKDMILYAIIGIVVALSSYIITIFVQGLFYNNPPPS